MACADDHWNSGPTRGGHNPTGDQCVMTMDHIGSAAAERANQAASGVPTGPGSVEKHGEAFVTQSIADDASELETVHFNGVPTLAINPAKLRDQNLGAADLQRIIYVGNAKTQEELLPPYLSYREQQTARGVGVDRKST